MVRAVQEGQVYRLKSIAWSNNTAFAERELRAMVPIRDGDIAQRENIAKGLAALRSAYLEKGYLNFTCIPDTLFDDEKGTIDLRVDLDEGGQFRLADLIVSGLPAKEIDAVKLAATRWKGEPFSPSLVDRLFNQFRSVFPVCANPIQNSRQQLDEKNHTAIIELNFDDCYSGWLNTENGTPVASCCPE